MILPQSLEFPSDYLSARARFRERFGAAGWMLESLPISASGPAGDALTIDAASSPGDDNLPVIILTSGLHGIEGAFGSAAQLAMLDECRRHSRLFESVRIVVVHALNPYGFAWRRRFDQNNVDLNRSFRVAGERLTGCSEVYRKLDRFLNPKRPPSAVEPYRLKAGLLIARHGLPALQQAIAEGQYEYPQGLFFGGWDISPTQQILQPQWSRWLRQSREVVHFDFHTGLGPSGDLQLMPESPLTEELARKFQPLGIRQVAKRDVQVAYEVRGSFGAWSARQAAGRDVLVVCAELGTESAVTVLGGLRAENQATHWAVANSPCVEKTRERLVTLFCPRGTLWRQRAAERTRSLFSRLTALFTRHPPWRIRR